jgi:hypothetical protein
MNNYEKKRFALEMARELKPETPEQLIEYAQKLEEYFDTNTVTEPKSVDFNAVAVPVSDPEWRDNISNLKWNPIAQYLISQFNSGNTVVCKARQIGMSTFLCDYISHRSHSERIFYVVPNQRFVTSSEVTIRKMGGNMENVSVISMNQAVGDGLRGYRADVLIVDGLAFIPYAKEEEFTINALRLGARMIFSSEPAQARGLFHDLWHHSADFAKVALTWNMSLYGAKDNTFTKNMIGSIGAERFQNEFLCSFRPSSDDSILKE